MKRWRWPAPHSAPGAAFKRGRPPRVLHGARGQPSSLPSTLLTASGADARAGHRHFLKSASAPGVASNLPAAASLAATVRGRLRGGGPQHPIKNCVVVVLADDHDVPGSSLLCSTNSRSPTTSTPTFCCRGIPWATGRSCLEILLTLLAVPALASRPYSALLCTSLLPRPARKQRRRVKAARAEGVRQPSRT